MEKIVVLNHKMNLIYDDLYDYINKINEIDTDNNIIICPSNIYLEAFANNCDWGIGSQNIHDKESGNFTGELSTLQIKSLGIDYSIVGHSERRHLFHETDEDVNKKTIACLDSNIVPIVCIGEDKGEDTETVLKSQLDKALENIENIQFMMFAYEPVYMIGTGKDVNLEKVKATIDYIYNYLNDKYKVVPTILYGGSVRENNIKDITDIEKISGVLIGSVSADYNSIEKIIKKIS